jgi:hypothetical protein
MAAVPVITKMMGMQVCLVLLAHAFMLVLAVARIAAAAAAAAAPAGMVHSAGERTTHLLQQVQTSG